MNAKQYKNKVSSLGCILCRHLGWGPTPACLHHVREGLGMSQRAVDWLSIPLCKEHHQGKTGIHSAGFYARFRLDEMDLLAMLIQEMAN